MNTPVLPSLWATKGQRENPQRGHARLSLLLGTLCLSLAGLAYAAHDLHLFELDQNAIDDPLTDGADANLIYCDLIDPDRLAACAGIAPSTALTANFVADKVGVGDDDIFAGAKDSLDINAGVPQDWNWKLGAANDKNDIGSVFVSLEKAENGDFILYFGLDKFANNGDAAIGFWFLQNPVELISGNPKGTFSQGHRPGDILVQADITQGGTIGRFDVYTWGPNSGDNVKVAPAQGQLTRAYQSSDCGTVGANDAACGVVNTSAQNAPWPYTFKGTGPTPSFPPVTYFEAGLNLSDLFPDGVPCLGAFVAETRQSQSETAELEDLVIGEFNMCSLDVRKTGPALSKAGDDISYHVEVENDGALPITKSSIDDTLVGDLTDGSNPAITTFDNCGASLQPGDTCVIEYGYTVPSGGSSVDNTVTATYLFGSDEATESSSHSVDLFTPDVTLDKQVDAGSGFGDGPAMILQGEAVDYKITVTNSSSANTPDLSCVITDTLLNIDPGNSDGDNDSGTLAVQLSTGASSSITASSGALVEPGDVVNTATVSCSPAGFPNVVGDGDSVTVKVKKRAVKLSVTKTGDSYSKPGDDVNYTITITNVAGPGGSQSALALTTIDDSLLGDLADGTNPAITASSCPVAPAMLAIGSACTIDLVRTTLGGDPNPLVNTVTVQGTNEFGTMTELLQDSHNVTLVAPGISVSKTCIDEPVTPGSSANFRMEITNTGDMPLLVDISDPLLPAPILDKLFGVVNGSCVYDDNAADGCLAIEAGIIAGNDPVLSTITVEGRMQEFVGLANVVSDNAGDTCDVQGDGDATRTLGFWRTHGSDGDRNYPSPSTYGYTCHIARDHVKFPIDLGWKVADNCADVFGIFWSNMAKQSDGDRRGKLCKDSLHASWQLLAAILNTGLSNGQAIPTDSETGLSLIDAMRNALASGDRREIVRLQGLLGDYNESGDDVSIEDADGALIPQADPNGTKEAADFSFGDCN